MYTLHLCPFQDFCVWNHVLLLIFRNFIRQLVWNWLSLFSHAVGKLTKFRMRIIVLEAPQICRLSTFCQVCFLFDRSQILRRYRLNAALALTILALTSSSICTSLDNVLIFQTLTALSNIIAGDILMNFFLFIFQRK